jgi:ribosomal protein S1
MHGSMSDDGAWERVKAQWRVGQVMRVTVVSHVAFGIFVDAPEGVLGLVENPKITDERMLRRDMDLPAVGTEIDAVVVDYVERHRQVRLSIRPSDLAAARS